MLGDRTAPTPRRKGSDPFRRHIVGVVTTRITRADVPLARPLRLARAFADPDAVVALIERGSPYRTEEAVHKHPGVKRTGGWFRNFWALGGKVVFDGAEPFFHNEIFLAAACELFDAAVVRPVAMMTNLNLPMAGLPPHLDLPFFRGAMNREVPSWMLEPMGYSGLFQEWAVPVASAITWFYDGEGGDFEYWPDGLDQPSRVECPPFSNVAVMADNEYTYHRVGPVGGPSDHVPGDGIPFAAELVLTDDRRWEVREAGAVLAAYDVADVRLSVLWKAYCFATEAEAAAYDDHSHDLTPELVTELFRDDLTSKGIAFAEPGDLWTDVAWRRTLQSAYPPSAAGRPEP
jgi:hypothetical protein